MDKEIRFVDVFGHTVFTIPDSGKITLTYMDGEQSTLVCKRRNEHHTEIGNTMYHIDEFASRMAQGGTVYAPEGKTPDTYEIHQTRNGEVPYMFRSYEEAGQHFSEIDYAHKYTGILSPETTLDELYRFHNIDSRPFGRSMRSVSVSDVIVLRRGGKSTAHYVDAVGFAEVPQFLESRIQYEIIPFEQGEDNLFFRMDGEAAERQVAVLPHAGRLRARRRRVLHHMV